MAFSFQPKMITDGLVFCFDAANRKSYVGSGTNAIDLSATQTTGSLLNGPTFSSERNGTIVFDGTNDYIQFPFQTILYDCTVEFWFKSTSTASAQYPLSISNNSNTFGLFFDMNDPGSYQTMWVFWNSNGSPLSGIPKTGTFGDWNDSTWRCYTFVRSISVSPHTFHYMNGTLVSNITRVGTQTTQFGNGAGYNINISYSGRPDAPNYFAGNNSITKIYNRALSATEVLQNYNALKGRFGLT